MHVYRVVLTGWVTSFRHPQLVTGMQPSLPLPPPSTIYGLVSAVVGYWINPEDCPLAYVFHSEGKAKDLESIYQFSKSNIAKSNVIMREWLTDWQLWLYFTDRKLAESFGAPVFPLILGRQQELAHVVTETSGQVFQEVDLKQTPTTLVGTVVPFPFGDTAGMVMALPLAMSPDLPRQAIGVRPWLLIKEPSKINHENVFHDPQLEQGVYFIGGRN